MDQLERAAIVCELARQLWAHGSWCGETHIQKASYMLQQMLNVDTGYEFILYKHGPFSFDLRDELASMRADGLLEVIVRGMSYGPSLKPTDATKTLAARQATVMKETEESVKFIATVVGSRGVAQLEQLATALYVKSELSISDDVTAAEKIRELKPHLSREDAEWAISELNKILSQAKGRKLVA